MRSEAVLTSEQIESNFARFTNFISLVGDENRRKSLMKLVEHFGERLVLAPGSSRTHYHDAYPGGLIDHSIRVMEYLQKLCKLNGLTISKESIIIAGLFHDIGKVGDLEHDYYIPQENAWRRENLGELYTHNHKIRKMSVTDRSLWLMQHFSIHLTTDEWLAIRLNDGMYVEANKEYSMREPTLALLLHQADRWMCQVWKDNQ